ncbi:MAG: hypothetical protein KDC38_06805 [Planctomycetes bacterium]|nr:hypothetical protein [Planctomycetota bacterium]
MIRVGAIALLLCGVAPRTFATPVGDRTDTPSDEVSDDIGIDGGRMTPPAEPAPERIGPAPERIGPAPERIGPAPERIGPAPERIGPAPAPSSDPVEIERGPSEFPTDGVVHAERELRPAVGESAERPTRESKPIVEKEPVPSRPDDRPAEPAVRERVPDGDGGGVDGSAADRTPVIEHPDPRLERERNREAAAWEHEEALSVDLGEEWGDDRATGNSTRALGRYRQRARERRVRSVLDDYRAERDAARESGSRQDWVEAFGDATNGTYRLFKTGATLERGGPPDLFDFWRFVFRGARCARDAETATSALEALRKSFGRDPKFDRFFEDKKKVLEELY